MEQLIEFWAGYEPEGDSFAHPADIQVLRTLSSDRVRFQRENYMQRVTGDFFGNHHELAADLSLMPQPYIGDIRESKVVLLLANPGYGYSDHFAETYVRSFNERLTFNLRQKFNDVDYPLLFLDPVYSWHGGHSWWYSVVKKLHEKLMADFDLSFRAALKFLSKNLSAIELNPYHSQSMKFLQPILDLPSLRAARNGVHQALKEGMDGNTVFVLARSRRYWFPEGTEDLYNASKKEGILTDVSGVSGRRVTLNPHITQCTPIYDHLKALFEGDG